MMDILSVISLVVLIAGGIMTYFSAKIYPFFFKAEDRDEQSCNLKVKALGFIIALIGASALFILKK